MSKLKINALASLAVLAGAPLAAQAEMVEMADTALADVRGQGPIANIISNGIGVIQLGAADVLDGAFALPNDGDDGLSGTDDDFAGGPVYLAGVDAGIGVLEAGFGSALLPITTPTSVVGGFIGQLLGNANDAGAGVADIAFMGPFRVLELIDQGKSTALDFLFFPITAPLDVAGNVFGALNDGVVGTGSRILTAPLNAVFGPVNRYVDGVTGRFEATVDGAAFAATEVKGALITNAFAGASAAAGNNGLAFTSRVFGRIAQAQAGLTNQRLENLAGKYDLDL